MDGVLLVDKPTGWTSHDVVAKVRGILRQQVNSEKFIVDSTHQKTLQTKNYKLKTPKVGHTGTLDPMATGLLILVIGNYTKKAAEFSKLDKIYEAELTLGATSTTGDKEGEITDYRSQSSDLRETPSEEEVRTVLEKFTGKIMQTPHKFSAIKVDGQRAYKAARAGQEVTLEPRPVTIYEITDVKYDYPTLKFTAKVSSGTYIRSLAEDIGEALGTGAYLSDLRRTEVGEYKIQNAATIEQIDLAKLVKVW